MYFASCGSDKVIRIYEKSSEFLVLEDEIEEEREKRENELGTGERTSIHGQKNQILPSHKTINSEKGVRNIYIENLFYRIFYLFPFFLFPTIEICRGLISRC